MSQLKYSEFLALPLEDAIKLIQNIFEDSHWVVQRGLTAKRDFENVEALFQYLLKIFMEASDEEKLAVLRAHPDLVGKAAIAGTISSYYLHLLFTFFIYNYFILFILLGKLTRESTQEQKGAGLGDLSDEEIQFFQENNDAYKTKFGTFLDIKSIYLEYRI